VSGTGVGVGLGVGVVVPGPLMAKSHVTSRAHAFRCDAPQSASAKVDVATRKQGDLGRGSP